MGFITNYNIIFVVSFILIAVKVDNYSAQTWFVQNYIYFTLQIESVFETYDTFFNLHVQVKEKYAKKEGTSPNGWDAIERERWVKMRLLIT